MAGLYRPRLLLVLIASAALLGCEPRAGVMGWSDCGVTLEKLEECETFVLIPGPPQMPSEECCAVVKAVNLPCICGLVNDPIMKIISMLKACFVAKMCGKPLPQGSKCGEYTVPTLENIGDFRV